MTGRNGVAHPIVTDVEDVLRMVLFSSSLVAESVDELSERGSLSALMKVIKDARTTVHINRQQ